jgi:predicted MPP superfamily phosphohydrolase
LGVTATRGGGNTSGGGDTGGGGSGVWHATSSKSIRPAAHKQKGRRIGVLGIAESRSRADVDRFNILLTHKHATNMYFQSI